jgi:hypothetical protein
VKSFQKIVIAVVIICLLIILNTLGFSSWFMSKVAFYQMDSIQRKDFLQIEDKRTINYPEFQTSQKINPEELPSDFKLLIRNIGTADYFLQSHPNKSLSYFEKWFSKKEKMAKFEISSMNAYLIQFKKSKIAMCNANIFVPPLKFQWNRLAYYQGQRKSFSELKSGRWAMIVEANLDKEKKSCEMKIHIFELEAYLERASNLSPENVERLKIFH